MPRDKEKITPAQLAAAFRYDPVAGVIYRIASKRPDTIGPVPIILNTGGYAVVYAYGSLVRAHRLAFVLMTGEWPEFDIDHINRDRTDNRWVNLRAATRAENLRNTDARKGSASGHKCVEKRGDKFIAYAREGGRKHHLGSFASADDASAAYEAFSGDPRNVIR